MKSKNIWDFWAVRYENLWVQRTSLGPTRELVIGEIGKLLGTAGREPVHILDAGCGTGQLAEELACAFPGFALQITGLDAAGKMIEEAEGKKIPGAVFLAGDVHNLPFPDGRFDIVTCCHSFPYYQDQMAALRELARVVKPEGALLLVQASANTGYDKFALSLVKLTTGRAFYPSAPETAKMLEQAGLCLWGQKRVPTGFFMPNIILSMGRRRRNHENSSH
ncbi:class I SAM-dependent methyltransferase [Candidatus Formimonas warabiya]|uniref:Methyltransferase type 11 domain-containing protein n=1 Tax=Formimonas warabiya TaxID=1761012 RepID=A0A3G1KRF6_FORW1|nr:class I SAM-dependent methyltransferase [Candidatus Formimonas warabiya]ATW25038.1 hypothetical protein DCMF_09845 [Candidatus Formimonas warabiya]